jgi:hypothetical protein
MKIPFKNTVTTIAATILLSISLPSSAGLIFGSAARTAFEGFQTTLGDTFIDFESFTPQTNLTTQISGVTFETTLQRWPSTAPVSLEVNVICSPSEPFTVTCAAPDQMIGGVRTGGVTDGQSIYEIVFDTPQLRVGFERIFNTSSLTRFFSGATLLAEHQNTVNREFVGFIAGTDLITRVEMDGLFSGGVYNVGYTDDLFFGDVPAGIPGVPEPATLALFGLGLAGMGFARRKKKSA